jgi:hypothetical protein
MSPAWVRAAGCLILTPADAWAGHVGDAPGLLHLEDEVLPHAAWRRCWPSAANMLGMQHYTMNHVIQ